MSLQRKRGLMFAGFFIIFIGVLGGVFGEPSWDESSYNSTHYLEENFVTYYNFTENLTDTSDLQYFSILEVVWENGNLGNDHSAYYWLPWNDSDFSNSSKGILKMDPNLDNETGNFTLHVLAKGDQSSTGVDFNFIINATNDYPEFTHINDSYDLYEAEEFIEYLNASDEANESHFPLDFNISFLDNCTHAAWTDYPDGEFCSLDEIGFNLTNFPNTSALMNFTPTHDDVGEYWANISVSDAGENYNCPHTYCDTSDYKENKTTWQIIKFNILSSLDINASDCQNKIFNENETGTCNISIFTKYPDSNISVSSYAKLRNDFDSSTQVDWMNRSWFVSDKSVSAANNSYILEINVTPGKKEIGNWTINLTIEDIDANSTESRLIDVYVNKTISSKPLISNINNLSTATYAPEEIFFNVSDNDFLIPDKNETYGGFKEEIDYSLKVYNSSNLSQELSNSSFNVNFDDTSGLGSVIGTNRTEGIIDFTLNESYIGNLTVNFSVRDSELNSHYRLFNINVVNNSAPEWLDPLTIDFIMNENDSLYLNLSENVSDPDGDEVSFSFELEDGESFYSFDNSFVSETGEINFTALNLDVGNHLVNISVSDMHHTTVELFNFTVFNVNQRPSIIDLDGGGISPSTINNGDIVNCSEGKEVDINLNVNDTDFKIPEEQSDKGFYKENLTIEVFMENLDINKTYTPDELFNFDFYGHMGSGDQYSWTIYTTSFTPNKTHVGVYNVTINVSDNSHESDLFYFTLNITEINHPPEIHNVKNFTKIVNETLEYDFNATDEEDRSDDEGNLSYDLDFIQGDNFVNENGSIFNTTTGVLNISFNDTQDGIYHINMTVSDTGGLNYTEDFWIYVYGQPNITLPSKNNVFNLTENITSVLNFSAEHSIGDNLTYEFWVDDIVCSFNDSSNCSYQNFSLRDDLEYFGNNTELTWDFTPNFLDETYGNLKNLTLKVYPSSDELNDSQRDTLSINKTFKINITHTNHTIYFTGDAGGDEIRDMGPISYGNTLDLNLSEYFIYYDFIDSYYNYEKEINFDFYTDASPHSQINWNFDNETWVVGFSAESNEDISEVFEITANQSGKTVSSNSFLIEFVEDSGDTGDSSSSTTRTVTNEVEVPVPFNIIFPENISAVENEIIEVPLFIVNNGTEILNGIDISGSVAKGSVLDEDFNISFSENYFESLSPDEKENFTMTIDVGRVGNGIFEIMINASVESPEYTDWNKMFLKVSDVSKIEERLLFASDFILENPECAELKEIVDEAEIFLENGKQEEAYEKATEAIEACKKMMSTSGKPSYETTFPLRFYRYTSYVSISIALLFLLYYVYRRFKLRIKKGDEQNLSSNKYSFDY